VSASGLVTYTPTANYNGSDSLTVRVTDQGTAFGQVVIPVTVAAVNDAPVAVNDSATTPQATPVTVNVLANDSDLDGTLDPTSVLATPPTNGSVSVNSTTGAITYTPNAAFSGSDNFSYTVKDNGGATSNTATVSITVTAVNQPPVAVNGALAATEDTAASGTLSATDPEGSALTFSIVSNGAKGTATITNAATGAFTYTPNANANGADSFSFQAGDGILNSNVATVTLNIAAVNDAPAPSAPAIATSEDTAGTSQVAANDPDAGATHTYSIVTAPTHGTATVSATGLVTYTPAANYNGADSLTVRVTDQSTAFGQVVIPITVAAVNDAPVAVNDSATTPQATPVTVDVLANDSDLDGTLDPASVLATTPANGTVSVNTTTGAITYTPNAAFSGSDSFSYTVKDNLGATSNAAIVSISVTAVNQAPVAVNGTLAASEDTAATGTLSASDPEGSALTFTIVSNGAKGTAVLTNAATGAYIYTPNANATGADTFSFRASDGALNSNVATVTVNIAAVNDAPAPSAPPILTNEDTTSTSQVVANGDGGEFSYRIVVSPQRGRAFVSATGLVKYIPAANYNGADSLVVRVTDQCGKKHKCKGAVFGQVKIPITVAPVNDPPRALDDRATTLSGKPVSINVLANDRDVDSKLDPATVTLTALPASGTVVVNPVTGAVAYTPKIDFCGKTSFRYTVKDDAGDISNTATVTVNVSPSAKGGNKRGRDERECDRERDDEREKEREREGEHGKSVKTTAVIRSMQSLPRVLMHVRRN
jgi:VCBS repeat-containing protein